MSNPATVSNTPANLTIGQSLRFFVESKGIVFVGSFDVLSIVDGGATTLGLSRIHKTNFQGGGYNLMQYDWNEGTPYITEQQNGLTNALLAFAPMSSWSQDMGGGWTVKLHELNSTAVR